MNFAISLLVIIGMLLFWAIADVILDETTEWKDEHEDNAI